MLACYLWPLLPWCVLCLLPPDLLKHVFEAQHVSESLCFSSVPAADRHQSGFRIHRNWILQICPQPTRRLHSGHLCPQWSGETKIITCGGNASKYKEDRQTLMFNFMCLQKHFTGKVLEELKQTARTQFGQVDLYVRGTELWNWSNILQMIDSD